MTDSNLKALEEENTVPEGAFGIGSKKTDDLTDKYVEDNTGAESQNMPRVLLNKLMQNSGAVMFPEQIQAKDVEAYEQNIDKLFKPKGDPDDTVFRAALAAGFEGTESVINAAGYWKSFFTGEEYERKDLFDLERLGVYKPEIDKDNKLYDFSKFGFKYGVPYTAAFKVLGAAGLSNWYWRDVVAGGATTSIFFDAFDKNISNHIQDTPLANPVTKILSAKTAEESNIAIESAKKFIEGGIVAKVFNTAFDAALNPKKVADAFVDVIQNIKKSPEATERLLFNLNQSKYNKFSNVRKYNSMDDVLSKGDDIVDVKPATEAEIKTPPKAEEKTVITSKGTPRLKKGKQTFQTTDKPVGTKGQNFNIFSDNPDEVAFIKSAYEEELKKFKTTYPKQVTDEMLIRDGDDYLIPETIQGLTKFAEKEGLRLPVLMAATVRRITGLSANLMDEIKILKELPVGSQESVDLKKKMAINTINFYRLIVGDKKASSTIARALRARQLAKARNPDTGKTPGELTGSNIEIKRAEDLTGGGSEIIRDIGEDIDNTFTKLDFSQDDLLKALEEDNFEGFAEYAEKLAAAHGDPYLLSKFVKESFGNKLFKISNEVFINGILSNPATHIKNTMGTYLNVITGPADLLAGSVTLQGVDPILARRAMAEFAMIKQSHNDAIRLAVQAFKDERNILDKGRMIVDSGADPTQRFAIGMKGGSFDPDGTQIQKVKTGEDLIKYVKEGLVPDLVNGSGTIIRGSTRALLAEDEYNKQVSFRMFLKGQLVEDGLRKGLKGKEYDDFVDKNFELGVSWINTKGKELEEALTGIQKSEIGEDLLLHIRDSLDYAADRTFTRKINNKFVNAAKHPYLKPILPFVNTPLNIVQSTLRRTPLYTSVSNKIPLLGGTVDFHRKQLQSSNPSVSARAKGVTRIGGAAWASLMGLALAAKNPFSEIALVEGSGTDFKQDFNKKQTGDIGYAFRHLKRDPKTNEPLIGADGQPMYYYTDCGKIGLEPYSSMCRAAGWWGKYRGYLEDEDIKNAELVISAAIFRDLSNMPMLESVIKITDIINQKPDALPKFLANHLNSALIPGVSLRKALAKRKYVFTDPATGKNLKGYWKPDLRIRKGDYINQEVRTKFDDGKRIPEDHFAYGTLKTQKENVPFEFFTKNVLLRFQKEVQRSFGKKFLPERHWITQRYIQYPPHLGPETGMSPFFDGHSVNDPVLSLLNRSKSKLVPPREHLFKQSPEGGIFLNYEQHRKLLDLIAFDKDPQTGEVLYQKYHKLGTNKKILELLDFIERGEVDETFTPDKSALVTDRVKTGTELRTLINDIAQPYIKRAKLKLFELPDSEGGAASLFPAYVRERRRQQLSLQDRLGVSVD